MPLVDSNDGVNLLKVKLVSTSPNNKDSVVFHITPTISESRIINYKSLSPVHMPGSVVVYTGTNNRTFDISDIKIASRTRTETSRNIEKLNLLRSWALPHFGSTGSSTGNDSLLGNPPEVLLLTAYSSLNKRGNIYKIPVVLTRLSIQYPNDVDYVDSMKGVPFPALTSIDLGLTETHSPDEFSKFDLSMFKTGTLDNW